MDPELPAVQGPRGEGRRFTCKTLPSRALIGDFTRERGYKDQPRALRRSSRRRGASDLQMASLTASARQDGPMNRQSVFTIDSILGLSRADQRTALSAPYRPWTGKTTRDIFVINIFGHQENLHSKNLEKFYKNLLNLNPHQAFCIGFTKIIFLF